MRLIKVRDLKKRPVTAIDILITMIFGEAGGPGLFDPNKEYQIGDTVYVVDDAGNITIWISNANGIFTEPSEPNWSKYGISDILERQLSGLSLNAITGYTNEIYKDYQFWMTISPPASSIDGLGLKEIVKEYGYAEVYVDMKMIPTTDWVINDNGGITFTEDYVKSLSSDMHNVLIIGYEPINVLTKMIRREQRVVVFDPKELSTKPEIEIVKFYDTEEELIADRTNPDIPKDSKVGIRNEETGTVKIYLKRDNNYVDLYSVPISKVEGVPPTKEIITIPYPVHPNVSSIGFDVYRDGEYLANNQYEIIGRESEAEDVRDDEIMIYDMKIIGQESSALTKHEYIFNFVYSVTNEVLVQKDDYATTINNPRDKQMLTLYDPCFMNAYQQIKLYRYALDGNTNISSGIMHNTDYILSRYHVNIPDPVQHFRVGLDKIVAPIWTYILPEYAIGEVRHNSQTFPIHLDDTMEIPIPYLKYDPVTSDMLLFNDGGIFISDVRWYIDQNTMKFFQYAYLSKDAFEEQLGLVSGERVDIRLVDSDSSVGMRSFYLDNTEDDQKHYVTVEDLTGYAMIMLFTSTGMYIPTNRYIVDPNSITFFDDWSLYTSEGYIQAVGFKYMTDKTRTIFSYKLGYAHSNDPNEPVTKIPNPVTDYNPNTDSLLIFNNNGQYIGQYYYDITEDGYLELLGEPLWEGGYVEVVLVRNLSTTISAVGGTT